MIYFFLLLLFFPVTKALFHPGFFPSHDGEWMVVRLSDFHRSFVSGQIPVRWAARLNHQFGYPVFNFLYPLSLYFAEFFHLLGLNFIDAIKAVFIASFFFSGLFMFLWIREKWGNLAGLTAALLYVYTPYRLVDVYVRGSLGEALAFVFPPLIFWIMERVSKKPSFRDLAIGSFAFAGLITAHNTLALLFTVLLIFYLFYLWFRQKSSFIILLGLGLSCFFWLPALWDKQYVTFEKVRVSNFFSHFPSLKQLIIPSWGYGPSLALSNQDTISFQVGLLNLIIALITLRWWRKLGFWLIAFWLVFFLMLPISSWLWQFLLICDLIQFPWRLLSLTSFISSFLAGFLISRFPRQRQIGLLLLSMVFLLWQARTYARPEYFVDRPLEFYSTNEATTTVANEYTPIWVKEMPERRAEKRVEIVLGSGEISNLSLNSKKVSFQADLQEESRIRFNTHYFPGWLLFVNGQKEAIDYQKNGLIEFSLPEGQFDILVSFRETPIRLMADLVSLFSLLMVAIIAIIKK